MHVKGTRRRRKKNSLARQDHLTEGENERGRLIEAAQREADLREVAEREREGALRESGRADASERTQVSSHCTLAAKSCCPAATTAATTTT